MHLLHSSLQEELFVCFFSELQGERDFYDFFESFARLWCFKLGLEHVISHVRYSSDGHQLLSVKVEVMSQLHRSLKVETPGWTLDTLSNCQVFSSHCPCCVVVKEGMPIRFWRRVRCFLLSLTRIGVVDNHTLAFF
jgi:hypothetical protein